MKSKMKTKLWPTAKALLVLTMLTVFPSVLCASDDYSISGATTVYDFSSASDADAYEVYPNSAKDGVAISDGVLTTNATHEYKIIFPSTTPITDNYMVSVDMKNGEGKVSAGLYLQASNATDAEACITSYEVHVEKEAGSNKLVFEEPEEPFEFACLLWDRDPDEERAERMINEYEE